ncbi:MAG: hypothetical protein NXI16_01465 [Alphaproteobacteria bacterium]|nr:hypothetical protein [Alphaproteobacteria bacterium]
MSAPKLRPFLDCSTSHISPDTADALEQEANGIEATMNASPVMAGPHGYFVHVSGLSFTPTPDDLKAVLDFAKAQGADYVLFDSEAPEIEGLPTYEWEEG